MRSLKIQKPGGGEFPGSIWIFIFSVEKAKNLDCQALGGNTIGCLRVGNVRRL